MLNTRWNALEIELKITFRCVHCNDVNTVAVDFSKMVQCDHFVGGKDKVFSLMCPACKDITDVRV